LGAEGARLLNKLNLSGKRTEQRIHLFLFVMFSRAAKKQLFLIQKKEKNQCNH